MVKNLPAMHETQVQSLGQEDPLEKGMALFLYIYILLMALYIYTFNGFIYIYIHTLNGFIYIYIYIYILFQIFFCFFDCLVCGILVP